MCSESIQEPQNYSELSKDPWLLCHIVDLSGCSMRFKKRVNVSIIAVVCNVLWFWQSLHEQQRSKEVETAPTDRKQAYRLYPSLLNMNRWDTSLRPVTSYTFTGMVLLKSQSNENVPLLFRYEVCVPLRSTGEKLHASACFHPEGRPGDTQVQTDATLEDTSSPSHTVTLIPWPQGKDRVIWVTGNISMWKILKCVKGSLWVQSYCIIAHLPHFSTSCFFLASVRSRQHWRHAEGSDTHLGGAKERGECLSLTYVYSSHIYLVVIKSSFLFTQLLSINEKWAKEYRTMKQYYREKVRKKFWVPLMVCVITYVSFQYFRPCVMCPSLHPMLRWMILNHFCNMSTLTLKRRCVKKWKRTQRCTRRSKMMGARG